MVQTLPLENTRKCDVVFMWGKAILTNKNVKCNRHGMAIHGKKKQGCVFTGVFILLCNNGVQIEAEKSPNTTTLK